jgi:hypothetical protein
VVVLTEGGEGGGGGGGGCGAPVVVRRRMPTVIQDGPVGHTDAPDAADANPGSAGVVVRELRFQEQFVALARHHVCVCVCVCG